MNLPVCFLPRLCCGASRSDLAVDVIWGISQPICSVAAPPAFFNIDLVMCSALIALHILPARYQ